MLNPQWRDAANFPRLRRSTLAHDIADHIRRRIVSGDIPVGKRLPSIQRLASSFGVSPPTMQAAVHILAAVGYVKVSPGNGTDVLLPSAGAAALSQAFRMASVFELAEMRAAIDQRAPIVVASMVAASEAGRRRMPNTITDIAFHAGELAFARSEGPKRYLAADLAFHESVLRGIRGWEIAREVYLDLAKRLGPSLLMAADELAGRLRLDDLHQELASAILDARPLAAARLARSVAKRELLSLRLTQIGSDRLI